MILSEKSEVFYDFAEIAGNLRTSQERLRPASVIVEFIEVSIAAYGSNLYVVGAATQIAFLKFDG